MNTSELDMLLKEKEAALGSKELALQTAYEGMVSAVLPLWPDFVEKRVEASIQVSAAKFNALQQTQQAAIKEAVKNLKADGKARIEKAFVVLLDAHLKPPPVAKGVFVSGPTGRDAYWGLSQAVEAFLRGFGFALQTPFIAGNPEQQKRYPHAIYVNDGWPDEFAAAYERFAVVAEDLTTARGEIADLKDQLQKAKALETWRA